MDHTESTSNAESTRPRSQSHIQEISDGSTRETSGKRRRISLACQACRTRKSRCDGARPKCSYCEDLDFDCVYIQSASSSNVIIGKEYLGTLEDRLKIAEANIKALQANQSRPSRQLRFDDNEHGNRGNGAEAPEQTHLGSQRNGGMEVNSDDVQDFSSLEFETDGMGAIDFSAEEDCAFFGPSSNISFTRHISRAMAQVTNISQSWFIAQNQTSFQLNTGGVTISQPGSPSGRLSSSRSVKNSNRTNVNIYTLPPECKVRELLALYFSNTGLLFPYIHRETFLETYEEMKRNNFAKVRRTWLGLLNIVMALTTSTQVEDNLNAEKRANESNVFYQRAEGLCDRHIMRGTSLEIVQYLLVMGQYLQGTQKSVETWTIHGLAVKAALQLGLHSAEASKRFSPLDQEIRKRTWYGCVVLDRTLSMTFGRPSAIPDDYVKLPLPCNIDEVGTPCTAFDSRNAVSVAFFNATITLYKIMWGIISHCYGGNLGFAHQSSVYDTVTRIFQFEQQLIEWKRDLPTSLTLPKSVDVLAASSPPDLVSSSLERLPVILTLRYHNLCVLLHRPVLVMFLDITGTDALSLGSQELLLLKQIGSSSIQICVQSSMEIIGIVSTLVTSTGLRGTWLGAWWFSLYYTYNAALVIFASLLILSDQNISGNVMAILPVSTDELRKCLDDAMMALRQLDTKNRMVERCANYLAQLTGVLDVLIPSATSLPTLSRSHHNNFEPSTSASDLTSTSSQYHLQPPYYSANATSAPENFMGHATNPMVSNTSPLGMDLGEFMLEDDIAFLNQLRNTGILAGMGKSVTANEVVEN